jgi:hypothetical protein
LTGNTAPFPWTYEYVYPVNAVQIWQIIPSSVSSVNNPLPTRWNVANDEVSAQQIRVILTNIPSAQAVYANMPSENTWDSLFRAAVVRLLASGFSMALAGRPDSMEALLQSGASFESIGETRDS